MRATTNFFRLHPLFQFIYSRPMELPQPCRTQHGWINLSRTGPAAPFCSLSAVCRRHRELTLGEHRHWCRVAASARILARGFAAGVPPWYALPTSDTRALILTIIGAGLAVVTIVVTVLSMQIVGVNTRIDDVRNDLRDFRTEVNARMNGFDTRQRNVEIAFGKVDQRLLIIERVVLPTPEPPAE